MPVTVGQACIDCAGIGSRPTIEASHHVVVFEPAANTFIISVGLSAALDLEVIELHRRDDDGVLVAHEPLRGVLGHPSLVTRARARQNQSGQRDGESTFANETHAARYHRTVDRGPADFVRPAAWATLPGTHPRCHARDRLTRQRNQRCAASRDRSLPRSEWHDAIAGGSWARSGASLRDLGQSLVTTW